MAGRFKQQNQRRSRSSKDSYGSKAMPLASSSLLCMETSFPLSMHGRGKESHSLCIHRAVSKHNSCSMPTQPLEISPIDSANGSTPAQGPSSMRIAIEPLVKPLASSQHQFSLSVITLENAMQQPRQEWKPDFACGKAIHLTMAALIK